MTVEIRDVLLKAAEDVQSGMWCMATLFSSERNEQFIGHFEGIDGWATPTTELASKYRCAEGSIILATRLLGGEQGDSLAATNAVRRHLGDVGLWGYNDLTLGIKGRLSPFEAGQQLAELFRSTAESL